MPLVLGDTSKDTIVNRPSIIPPSACLAAFGVALALLAACGGDSRPPLFSSEVEQVVIEVDYQAGAEPFTESNVWSLFAANAQALFAGAPRDLIVPVSLGEMERLEDVSAREFTTQDIISLSRSYLDEQETDASRAFHVLFLDGVLVEDGERDEKVLGVSIEGTNIIALFKPVVAGASSSLFVEQSSLVHEFGHAVGLVNLTLEMVTPHHDAAHGAHCTNSDCVMYYLHEGRGDLIDFVRRFQVTKSPVLFGSECLDDAHAASR